MPLEGNSESADETMKEEKKTKKHGLLNWLKLRVGGLWIFVSSQNFQSFFVLKYVRYKFFLQLHKMLSGIIICNLHYVFNMI